jgi:hypothetical protein
LRLRCWATLPDVTHLLPRRGARIQSYPDQIGPFHLAVKFA